MRSLEFPARLSEGELTRDPRDAEVNVIQDRSTVEERESRFASPFSNTHDAERDFFFPHIEETIEPGKIMRGVGACGDFEDVSRQR